jgi:hypothetical protein
LLGLGASLYACYPRPVKGRWAHLVSDQVDFCSYSSSRAEDIIFLGIYAD